MNSFVNKKKDEELLNSSVENTANVGAAANAAASPVIAGDINGDGKHNAADARLTRRYTEGFNDNLTDEQIGRLDVNADGKIDDTDASDSLKVSAKMTDFNTIQKNAAAVPQATPSEAKKNSEYDDLINQYLDEYSAIGKFSYDPNNPLSQYYDRTYKNAALLNQQNALAAGGTGYNSAKQALANSAYNSAIAGLGDVQQQLYQMALDSYQQERSEALQNIDLARGLKQDELNQEYQQWHMENTESEQARDQANIDADRALNHASLAASYGNYDALSKITGLDFSSQENRDAFNDAYAMYQATGSLAGFKDLGIDTSFLESERTKEQAILAASYGDYSGLKDYGIDISKITKNEEIQFALCLAEFGDYSRLEELLGGDLSNAAYANQLEISLTAAQAGDYSKLEEMGFDTTYIKQLNNSKLSSGSSGGGGGVGNSRKIKSVSQSDIDGAIDAYNVGGEANLAYYLQGLADKGYTDEQQYFISEQVLSGEDDSVDAGASNENASSASGNSIASALAEDRFAPSRDIWSVIDFLKDKK